MKRGYGYFAPLFMSNYFNKGNEHIVFGHNVCWYLIKKVIKFHEQALETQKSWKHFIACVSENSLWKYGKD